MVCFNHDHGDVTSEQVAEGCKHLKFGGEEFVVILPQADIETARKIAEKIRCALCTKPFQSDDTKTLLTTSIGVCATRPDGDDYNVLLQKVDEALYKAKKNGRNRVEIAELNQCR